MRNLLMGLALVAVACSDEPKAPTADAAKSTTAVSSNAAAPPKQGGPRESTLKWTAPASFELVDKPSPMRLATYKIKPAEGDSEGAELSVSQAGGDTTSNIERWKKQFSGDVRSNVEERTVGSLKVSVVTIEGTFMGMSMPGAPASGPKENSMLLGAIVEGAKGEAHFFKLTGPAKTVDSARKAFDELVQSLAPR